MNKTSVGFRRNADMTNMTNMTNMTGACETNGTGI